LIVLACVFAAALGFVPTSPARGSSVTMMAARSKSVPFLIQPAKLDGSMAGDEGFDPLGLSNIDSGGLGIDLFWMREAELKHARVAMLATLGLFAQESGFVLPGYPTTKNQIQAFWECVDKNPGPIFGAVIFLGMVEVIGGLAITEGRKSGRAPGDYGFNPLSLGKSPASAKDYAVKEIRNGRLAMWAAAGMLLQGTITSDGALENLFQ
jgi:light-harvesting complex I chlorophyll a/b binding protein 1